jgi:hypothetical protein
MFVAMIQCVYINTTTTIMDIIPRLVFYLMTSSNKICKFVRTSQERITSSLRDQQFNTTYRFVTMPTLLARTYRLTLYGHITITTLDIIHYLLT